MADFVDHADLDAEEEARQKYLRDYMEKQKNSKTVNISKKKTEDEESSPTVSSGSTTTTNEKLLLGQDKYGVSYLDDYEDQMKKLKPTTNSDKSRWGRGGEIFDETKLEKGSYLEKMEQFEKEKKEKEQRAKEEAIKALKDQKNGYLDPEENVFAYEDLKDKFPKGVDPTKKEEYLDDDEFESLFGMPRDAFLKLPLMKKKTLKKKLGLF